MLDHSAGSGQHTYAERGVDLYETPPEAVHALLKVEKLPLRVWEPACGPGSIVRTLEAAGHDVLATDLYDHGQADFGYSDVNFLDCKPLANGFLNCVPLRLHEIEAVVTNPPYQLAQKFVEKALELKIPLVIMLLRLAFMESERRSNILDNAGLARIHLFKKRLPMMHRVVDGVEWQGRRASSAIPFAWFVWIRGHQGPTVIDRISWEKTP